MSNIRLAEPILTSGSTTSHYVFICHVIANDLRRADCKRRMPHQRSQRKPRTSVLRLCVNVHHSAMLVGRGCQEPQQGVPAVRAPAGHVQELVRRMQHCGPVLSNSEREACSVCNYMCRLQMHTAHLLEAHRLT